MKKFLLSAMFGGIALLSVSCERCMQCEYYSRNDELIIEEKCGSADEMDAFESSIEDSSIVHRSKFSCASVH